MSHETIPFVPELETELTPSDRFVLSLLLSRNGSMKRTDLIQFLNERTVDRSVSRLEDKGVIRRDRDGQGGDLRFVRISITEENQSLAISDCSN